MMKTASLPMYDLPEVRDATDAWWSGVAKHMQLAGITEAPLQLQHDVPVKSLWQDKNLLLSQCCGFDVVHGLKDCLDVLMITGWAAEGCYDGHYSSWVVVHEDSPYQHISELYDSVAVINGVESHSGMNALLSLVHTYSKDGYFFQRIDQSGTHVDSLVALQQKVADVAAIDCVTYALLKEYRPSVISGVRIIGQTAAAPAHPYVTRASTSSDTQYRIQQALDNAFNDRSLDSARATILLKEGIFGRSNDYRKIAENFQYDARLLDVIQNSPFF